MKETDLNDSDLNDSEPVDADLGPNGDLGANENWDHEQVCQHARRAIDSMGRADAKAAGLTIEQWLSLSEHERIKFKEDAQDAIYARENHRTTLEDYRRQTRLLIESSQTWDDGFPQWLRDMYAAERPVEIVVEYLSLLTALETTSGDAQEQVIKQIAERTWRGWAIERTVEEARTLLLAEIERTGLTDYFLEVQLQQRERAN